jgi:hypothetical protein
VLYFANPCGDASVAAMAAGRIGLIDTPRQYKRTETDQAREAGAIWCADNGCFSNRWNEQHWWRWLTRPVQLQHRDTCAFAVAPDVVADAAATLTRSTPWLPEIRALGYPVAYVAQDGIEGAPPPWELLDVLFIGGTDEFKLGAPARALVTEAKVRGKRVHLGRCNSRKRWLYAEAIGCDSADGTFLTYGPDTNLPRMFAWMVDDALPIILP